MVDGSGGWSVALLLATLKLLLKLPSRRPSRTQSAAARQRVRQPIPRSRTRQRSPTTRAVRRGAAAAVCGVVGSPALAKALRDRRSSRPPAFEAPRRRRCSRACERALPIRCHRTRETFAHQRHDRKPSVRRQPNRCRWAVAPPEGLLDHRSPLLRVLDAGPERRTAPVEPSMRTVGHAESVASRRKSRSQTPGVAGETSRPRSALYDEKCSNLAISTVRQGPTRVSRSRGLAWVSTDASRRTLGALDAQVTRLPMWGRSEPAHTSLRSER